MYSEAVDATFIQESVTGQHKKTAEDGMTSSMLVAFVRQLVDNGAPIAYQVFKKNLKKTGHFHRDAIFDLKLKDGVYIVGAMKQMPVAHCFALQVAQGEHIVHDDGLIMPLLYYGSWMMRVMFARKFQVYKD
ncbi:hypothetical protein PINS_up016875 [Pythium insidiosum]|nr:hypothetical protein PINS_up016875 [Pythium insidiosum]